MLRREQKKSGIETHLNILDVGMVIKLEEKKRHYFISFLSEVIQGNPTECAKMIHRISKYGGKLLEDSEYPVYFQDLEEMFTLIRKCSL